MKSLPSVRVNWCRRHRTFSCAIKHTQLDTEHLLLAMLEQNDGLAVQVLQKLDVDTRRLGQAVEEALARAPKVQYADEGAQVYITPRIKRVFDLAKEEAQRLQDSYIGVEHLLLGLIKEGDGGAARLLKQSRVDEEKVYKALAGHSRQFARHRREPRRKVPHAGALLARPDGPGAGR